MTWRQEIDDAEQDADDRVLSEMTAASEFARAVDEAAYALRVREAARDKVTAEKAGQAPPFDAGRLVDILARPPEPPFRVADLIPSEGGTLVVAQRKTGKTIWALNLARSLLTGEEFLGRFGVRPLDGRVGFLNYEVSAARLARWAHEHDVPDDQLYLVNLRGRRNPLSHPDDRATLAERLRREDVEALVVDPFGRAFTGTSQNDSGEVGSWLGDLDRFARAEAGCADIILTAHAGWNGERSRGSTALEEWADSIVNLTRDDEDGRFMKAEGRDVSIEEDLLDFRRATRTLTLAGEGSRKAMAKTRQVKAQMPYVLELLRDNPPSMSGNQLDIALAQTDLPHSKGDGARAGNLLEARGQVLAKDGSRRSRLFSLLTSPTSLNSPQGSGDDFPHLPLRGEVAGEVRQLDLPDPLTTPTDGQERTKS